MIGAGASGLVASRHLLRCGLQPCIFEANSRIQGVGGAWNPAGASYKMWDNLTPNLSKYTCAFSDYLWPDDVPTFPSRVDMHRYLDGYASAFLDPDFFRFNSKVTNVRRCDPNANANANIFFDNDGDGFKQQLQVEWTDEDGKTQSQEFDGVIVATGFFSAPFLPRGFAYNAINDNIRSQHRDDESAATKLIIHSSEYRSPYDFCNQTVAVCGSSYSALEIAADVRKQAAKVVSILPRIPYVLPRYVPTTTPSRSAADEDDVDYCGGIMSGFAPLDTVFYQRSRDAPQIPASIAMTESEAKAKHAFLRQLSGSRKQRRQSPLGFPSDDSGPPLVAISDDYLNLVIDGNIDTVRGRVASVTKKEISNCLDIKLDSGETLSGIDRIIACTGYQSRLDFLEPSILELLEHDQSDMYAPLTLAYDAFSPKLPGLGFVGMYKGPYFGIMELQARLLAGMFSGKIMPSRASISEAMEESRKIRNFATTSRRSLRAHFPRYDYIGFMDSLAHQLNLVPSGDYGRKGAVVSPHFYQESDDIASRCKIALDDELHRNDNKDGSGGSANIARVALSALIGKWDFCRTITEFNSQQPPQTVTGTIDFSHIPPPKMKEEGGGDDDDSSSIVDDSDKKKNQEWSSVLYDERGVFQIAGKELEVFRQYEYEYKPNGILEIYFVEFGKRAHLFLSLKFLKKEKGYWVATSDHLCINDLYKANFKIAFDGLAASKVTMTYRVRGPNKDYESVTHLMPSE